MGGGDDIEGSRFAPWHRWDRQFFLLYILAAWGVVFIGFYPSVSDRFQGHADYPAPIILQIHVFTFTAWLCLLTTQIMLVRVGRQDIHKLLGIAGIALIPVLLVTGIGAELHSQRFYSPKYPANLQFFIAPLVQMLVFATCASLAFLFRKDSPAHKRFILLATSMILVAAYNRWWGEGLYEIFGDGFWGMLIHNFAGPDMLMVAAMAYDAVTRHKIHWAYKIMVPLILAAELMASFIYHHPAWPPIAKGLVGL